MCAYYLVYWLNVRDQQSNRSRLLRGITRHSTACVIDVPTWDGTP